jgi:hypothetical protein
MRALSKVGNDGLGSVASAKPTHTNYHCLNCRLPHSDLNRAVSGAQYTLLCQALRGLVIYWAVSVGIIYCYHTPSTSHPQSPTTHSMGPISKGWTMPGSFPPPHTHTYYNITDVSMEGTGSKTTLLQLSRQLDHTLKTNRKCKVYLTQKEGHTSALK